MTSNAFIAASSISNRSKESSDISDQNVTSSTQSLSDFEILRPTKTEQGERSSSLRFTQAGRCTRPNWKESFPWIEYNASRDVMTWEVCSWAVENNKTSPAAKLRLKGQSKALISGFSAWRRGSAALSKHQNSQHYKECMNVRCTLMGNNNTNVFDQLISAHRATAASN